MTVAAVPSAVAPIADTVAPVPNLVGPVSDVIASIQDMLTAVGGAVVPVTQLQSELYSFLVNIAQVAPLAEVIAWIRDTLTSVAGAVAPLTQLSSELASFLFGIIGVEPVLDAWGGIGNAVLSGAVHAGAASKLSLLWAFAGISGMPVGGNPMGIAPLGGIAASTLAAISQVAEASSLLGLAQPFFRARLQRTPARRVSGGTGRCRSVGHRRAADPHRSRGASPFPGGAGSSCSAWRRRAADPHRSRGARRILPGQSRLRGAHSEHRALRPSGRRSGRCRSLGVHCCTPSEDAACRPSGGVKRFMSFRKSRLAAGARDA